MPENQEMSCRVPIGLALMVIGAGAIYFAGETNNICLFWPGLMTFIAGALALA